MSAQHTPAPWTIGVINPKYFQINGDGDAICVGGENAFCYAGNLKANARIIAAAPDLLRALKELTRQIEIADAHDPLGHPLKNLKALMDARVVIAEATGKEP